MKLHLISILGLALATLAQAAPAQKVQLGIPQPENGDPIPLYVGTSDSPRCHYNPKTLEYVMTNFWDEGPLKGQHRIFKINPVTGEVTRNDGVYKGRFNADGSFESTTLPGQLRMDENGRIWRNGEYLGYTTPTYCYTLGFLRGHFDKPVNPLVNAFFFVGMLTWEDDVEKMKTMNAENEKNPEEVQRGIPKPDPAGMPTPFVSGNNNSLGTYDPRTLEIIFNQTWESGSLAGKNIIYKIDPATGEVTRNDGASRGRIYPDGSFDSPFLPGILKLDMKGGLWRNDELFGEVSLMECRSYGVLQGSFLYPSNQQVIAFTYLGLMTDENDLAEYKKIKAERDAQAAKEKNLEAKRPESKLHNIAYIKENNTDYEVFEADGSRIGFVRPNYTGNQVLDKYLVMDEWDENNYRRTFGYIVVYSDTALRIDIPDIGTIGWIKKESNQLTIEESGKDGRRLGYVDKYGNIEDANHKRIGVAKDHFEIWAALYFFF